NEVTEMFHQLDSHGLVSVNFRALDRLPNLWVEILLASAKLEKERLMVDTRAEERDVLVRDVHPLGQRLACSLHTVAKSDVRLTGSGIDCPAVGRHGIHVVN